MRISKCAFRFGSGRRNRSRQEANVRKPGGVLRWGVGSSLRGFRNMEMTGGGKISLWENPFHRTHLPGAPWFDRHIKPAL